MKLSISKAKIAAVITIALLMASIALMAMPIQLIQPVQAQLGTIGNSPSTIADYPILATSPPAGVTPAYSYATTAYMSFTPNPIGVGQQLLFNVWTTPGSTTYFYRAGYKVTLQKPDGTTEVAGPFNSYFGDCTAWFQYVVDQVGTWKAKFEFPGTYLHPGNYSTNPGVVGASKFTLGASVYWEPSSTDWQEITVQQEWINSWPSVPLPTDYWMRPVSIENREWWSILGNYPFTGAVYYPGGRVLYASAYDYTAYVQAPNTAHVVWRRQGALAGLIGGQAYQYSTYTGGGNPSIVYAGRCYQSVTKPSPTGTGTQAYWQCYDLRTGQLYWEIPLPSTTTEIFPGFVMTTALTPTAILYESPTASADLEMAASGTYSVSLVAISGGRLYKFNPFTGVVSLNISIAPITSGTIWNNDLVYSVQDLGAAQGANRYRMINWTMKGSTTNFTSRIGSNITWPISSAGGFSPWCYDYDAGIVFIGSWGFTGQGVWCLGYNVTTIDLHTGQVLVNIGSNDTQDLNMGTGFEYLADRGKVAMPMCNRHWNCWDARTGKLLWMSDKAVYPWGAWWSYSVSSYDFNESKGAIIAGSYAGLYAIDWDTGKILWYYSSQMPPFESPYGDESIFTGVKIADGKIYAYGGEHTTTYPVTRGWHLHCINATNGKLLWKITGAMSPGAIADGYLTASNPNDGYMYVFGKGKSQTTVSTPDTVVAKGTGMVIKGTVMDMSPGDQGSVTNPTARLDSPTKPGTVPCVSAASMATQMEYLYMQHPIDGLYHNETITGVPVILTAIGSKGNVINIGTTTTNGYGGTFGMAWTPPDEDTYTIMASFAGDDSYGSSMATTAATVGPAPASPTPTPEQPQAQPDNTPMYFAISTILIILAIAIVGVLTLRKRP